MINKIINLIKSIYVNYGINQFNLNIFIILLYFFDYKKLLNETALLISFLLLITQIFSGNARTLVLAYKNSLNADHIIILRLLFLFPIIILSLFFVSLYDFSDRSFSYSIIFLVLSQWIYEIYLSKKELKSKKIIFKHFILSFIIFLLILISLYLVNIILIKIIIFTYSICIFYYSISYLLENKISLPNVIIDLKALFKSLVFSSYGSSLSISISNFFFRYFLIKLLSEDVASTLIICFMVGSFPVSLFTQIIGASLFRFKINFKNVFKYFKIIFLLITLVAIYLTNDLLLDVNSRVFELNELIKLTIFASLVGIYPMMLGLFRRQFNLNTSSVKDTFFYLDMIYGLSIISVIPLLYVLNNPNYFAFSFLFTGVISFFIFNFSKTLNNKRIINFFLFLIPVPIFFVIFDRFKNFEFKYLSETIIPINATELSVQVPISCLILPFLLLALLNNRNNISDTIYFISLSFFIALSSLTFTGRINFFNFTNLVQFYIPLIAIICGEIVGYNNKLCERFKRYFIFIILIVMILQIIFSIYYETDYLNPNIFLFYIYQTEQYSSLAFILIFFIFIHNRIIKSENFMNYKIYLPIIILLTYVYLSKNLLLFIYTISYFLFLLIFVKKNLIPKIIIFFTAICLLWSSYDRIIFNISTFIESKNFYYQTYFLEITKNIKNLLFGSNTIGELYVNMPGIFNYYLDFIYNFGLIAITPLFLLIFLTIKNTYIKRKSLIINQKNLALFFVVILVLFVDSFLKVSLKQPYIGIILMFIWGVYYSQLKKLRK